MKVYRVGIAVLVLGVFVTGRLVRADDKKTDEPPPRAKGQLPANWKQLGLTADQVKQVYTIQAKYNAEIDKLKAKIDALKAEEKGKLTEILSKEQKDKLKEIRTGEKPKDDKSKDIKNK